MPRKIGVVVNEHVVSGAVEGDQIVGALSIHPADGSGAEHIHAMPSDEFVALLADEIKAVAEGEEVEAVGIGLPGFIRCGVIEDSPNLQQLKGFPMETVLRSVLAERNIKCDRITISNDADVVAAGIAAKHDKLHQLVRVWTLGNGVGYGRYPCVQGVWEGGHIVVSLDPAEKFCGCGGRGHLEGIVGHRAMRLRFLDMEPEEIFESAEKDNDPRCKEFVHLWHKALAAGTASSIHMSGPGKFYITGRNARFVNLQLLNRCIAEMVKMSPLQGYVFEVVQKSDEIAVVGAVVNALRG